MQITPHSTEEQTKAPSTKEHPDKTETFSDRIMRIIASGPEPHQDKPETFSDRVMRIIPRKNIVGTSFEKDPVAMTCPHCRQEIQTLTYLKPGIIGE